LECRLDEQLPSAKNAAKAKVGRGHDAFIDARPETTG
jgi:hypothetical protein